MNSTATPLINIIVRTSGRPNYFARCIDSIRDQTYIHWLVHVVTDDEQDCADYVELYDGIENVQIYIYDKPERKIKGSYPHHSYLNITTTDDIKSGWVIVLDDDFKFTSDDSLRTIVEEIKKNTDNYFYMWT